MGIEQWPSQKSSEKPPKKRTAETGKSQDSQELQGVRRESEAHKSAREQLSSFFDEHTDPKERTSAILKRIEPFFKYTDKKILPEKMIDEMKSALLACEDISDKQKYLDTVMGALKPILDMREARPNAFEEAQARAMNKEMGFTEINRLLSYGKSGSTVHIHAPAGETVRNKITLYREGLRTLAEIIASDPEIKEVTATSSLVAEHPKLFTRAGFEVGEVPDEIRQQHFASEEREIKFAKIDREEFLKRFLRK